MLKLAVGVFVGAAVGTLAYELVKKKPPQVLVNLRENAKNAVRSFTEGFDEGYRGRKTA
jgi:large-conductance mechanosensitive channel